LHRALEIGQRSYQQRPAPETGDYFLRDWIRWYDNPPPRDTLRIYGSSDYAVTANGGDFTVHGIAVSILRMTSNCSTGGGASINGYLGRCVPRPGRALAPERMGGRETARSSSRWGPFIDKTPARAPHLHLPSQYVSSTDKGDAGTVDPWPLQQGQSSAAASRAVGVGSRDGDAEIPTGKYDDQVDVLSLFGRILNRMQTGSRPEHQRRSGFSRWPTSTFRSSKRIVGK
jgi:hypothetical protein